MPIYGYRCLACEHDFEVMQKMSDPAPAACPVCGRVELRKLLSAAGFQLKGSGWYQTDFKGGNGKSDKPEKSKPEKSDSAADTGSAAGCGSGACGACGSN